MVNDVLIIGAGPVGLTAALLLARHGLRVEVIEKRSEPSTEPRAVSLDDEGLRIWQGCGLENLLREDCAGGEPGQCICTYYDERGRAFLRVHQRTSELGHPHGVAIHQGRIEGKLLRAAEQHPLIRVRRGSCVRHIEQSEGRVVVTGAARDGGSFECGAPWAVACDGVGSTVRRLLGIPWATTEMKHPWLVANLVDGGEPGHVAIRCSSRAAAVTIPLPHGMRRVEVQLEADDDGAWLSDEAAVRRRLRLGWEGAASAPIAGVAVCRFRVGVAQRWRDRRVFLAGDAAHTMPPFAGQGLGSGLRDVANLSFKVAGVCQSWLSPAVLESYERERKPHVERIARLTCRLGRLMMPRSAVEAMVVRGTLRTVGAWSAIGGRWRLRGPNIQPRLTTGFLVPSPMAGRYLPQPVVIGPDHRRVRLDELLGPRMTWIVLGDRASAPPHPPHLRPPLLQPCDTVLMEGRDFRDPEHALRRRYGAGSVVLVRPDRVVYCHIRAFRHRPDHVRRSACLSDTIALREVREVVASPRCSSFPLLAGASPTARTRPW